MSDLLGIDISVKDSHVCLRQTNYIKRLFAEFFPDGVPPGLRRTSVPCLPDLPQLVLESMDSKEDVDPSILKSYQRLVGALLYCAQHASGCRVRRWHVVSRDESTQRRAA